MAMQTVRLFDYAADAGLIPQMAQIHHDCIVQDHTMIKFMPPLDMRKIVAFWQESAAETLKDTRDIFVHTIRTGTREEVVGVVQLSMPRRETGPFRCNVQMLLVSPNHRRKGIARLLMQHLETAAKQNGLWLVMLDTTIGQGSASVYPRLGYSTLGIIPNFGYSPEDGKLRDEIFFYKDLRDPGTITEYRLPQ